MHESDLAKLSEEAIKYKCRIEEMGEECERKVEEQKRMARDEIERGMVTS